MKIDLPIADPIEVKIVQKRGKICPEENGRPRKRARLDRPHSCRGRIAAQRGSDVAFRSILPGDMGQYLRPKRRSHAEMM